MTVNGANHVIILNLEWSPETTLQAEDRCTSGTTPTTYRYTGQRQIERVGKKNEKA
ncbi:MAG: hypothetical protein JXA37_03400 [Chloroflexia bacterium]|nr:hypothetical protein [Chloroflexia bacterium]